MDAATTEAPKPCFDEELKAMAWHDLELAVSCHTVTTAQLLVAVGTADAARLLRELRDCEALVRRKLWIYTRIVARMN